VVAVKARQKSLNSSQVIGMRPDCTGRLTRIAKSPQMAWFASHYSLGAKILAEPLSFFAAPPVQFNTRRVARRHSNISNQWLLTPADRTQNPLLVHRLIGGK
jgi:hypothetical protein